MDLKELTKQDVPIGGLVYVFLSSLFPAANWENDGEEVAIQYNPRYTVRYQTRAYIQSEGKFEGPEEWAIKASDELPTPLKEFVITCLNEDIIRGGMEIITDITKLPPGSRLEGLSPLTEKDKNELREFIGGIVVK